VSPFLCCLLPQTEGHYLRRSGATRIVPAGRQIFSASASVALFFIPQTWNDGPENSPVSGSCFCRGVDCETVRGWNAGTVTKGDVGIHGVGGGEGKLGPTWADYRLVFNVAHTLSTNKRRIIKSMPVRLKLWRSEDIMWQECGRGLGFHSRLEYL
jgi:hypothetical protein